jgi:hypothetical protein
MLVSASSQPLFPLCTVHGEGRWLDRQTVLLSAAMLSGMMAPLLAQHLTWVRALSFASRRRRAIALFLTGYACVWMGALSGLWALSDTFRTTFGSETAAVLAALGL